MRNYSKVDDKDILINALFIQPTVYCSLKCPGCYVKGWEKNAQGNVRIPPDAWWKFMRAMVGLEEEWIGNYGTNQITFALDNAPLEHHLYMENIRDNFFDVAADIKYQGIDTETHITTNQIGNLIKSNHTGEFSPASNYIKYIDMISLSGPVQRGHVYSDKLREVAPNTTINWNRQIQAPVNEDYKDWLAFQIQWTKAYMDSFDSIYLIAHKPNLGSYYDSKYLTWCMRLYEELRSITDKVHLDGCLGDAKKYASTGHGCSSNISRFQIWPDGSVSGCPYNQKPVTEPAKHKDDMLCASDYARRMLNNIREAAKVYEFDGCRIPEALYPESDPVTLRKYKSLQILED